VFAALSSARGIEIMVARSERYDGTVYAPSKILTPEQNSKKSIVPWTLLDKYMIRTNDSRHRVARCSDLPKDTPTSHPHKVYIFENLSPNQRISVHAYFHIVRCRLEQMHDALSLWK